MTSERLSAEPTSAVDSDTAADAASQSVASESVASESAPPQSAPAKPDVAQNPLFSDFPIKPEIIESLAAIGIERTFAIQLLTLPIALAGADLIGQARTGTGKTLGFGVPMLNRIAVPSPKGAAPQALVIAPTRELAVQVSGDLSNAGKHLGAKVVTIYGGRAYEPQVEALKSGCDVVVGTPGRLLDLTQQGYLQLGNVRCLVLDEADEMLDLGFLPDIEKLMSSLPQARQTMLFSATMPGPIVVLARQFMNQPVQIRAESGDETPATEHVDQFVYRAHAMDKVEIVSRVLQATNRGLTMVFTRTKRTAQKVADELVERGFAAGAVHGDLGQGAREQALRAFRSGKVDVLVATDVAARGLDVDDVTHVINYQCPEDAMTYVHRIGRTARAGKSGTAVTLVDWDDLPKWKLICDTLNLPFHEPSETYSTSSHLYLELGIPEGAGGTLPRADRTRAGLDAEVVEDLGGPAKRRPAKSTPARGGRDAGGRDGGSRVGGGRDGGSGRSGRSRYTGSARATTAPTTGPDESASSTPAARRNRSRRRTRSGGSDAATAPADGSSDS
ncbi:MAG: ATP-dependent helicase [Pseudonocardiales bacterium]|nr:ATP-dependent helicase [Pseudonocardiales bacterium]